ncbi:MAG: 1-acyl-sn-glycerol-3-phosphate acyltransferase [Paludibacteraceae bacterium]|nr:1-acyl-sn-glycerol-3-phosphate acyltransferase [Paludibacteraceae bacterium]
MDKFRKIRAYRTEWLQAVFDWIIAYPILKRMERKTTSSVELAYLGDRKMIEQDIRHGAFFMTNHRDICMDSAWLSILLRTRYFIRPYIGIGNNLFGKWWIEPLVRTLRCFVVIRNVSPREQLANAQLLSEYLQMLRYKGKSIWLAQRQGRAKDGNDLTQSGVLKMLTLGSDDFFEAVKLLNICPVSINYEYDPCDYLKAREMQLVRDNPQWKKSRRDDLISMQTGIEGQKGRVVYRLTRSINPEIDELLAKQPEVQQLPRNEQIQLVCNMIDRHIHQGYELYERGKAFEQYLQQQLRKVNLPNPDEAFLMDKLHEMYETPVINHRKSLEYREVG